MQLNKAQSNTAIVITSSWIPTHPSTKMIDQVINSTSNLAGLSQNTPMIITIDDLPLAKMDDMAAFDKKMEALEDYSMNLSRKYMTRPNFHILPGMNHLHIGGSVMKALELIDVHYPAVEYVYYVQHDFEFTSGIDHDAFVKVMENFSFVNYILFPQRPKMSTSCGNITISQPARALNKLNSSDDNRSEMRIMELHPTPKWSDNNHFARFHWYKETIASIISLKRAPEDPLHIRARQACRENKPMGLYLYDEVVIGHLDGRHTSVL